MAEKLSSSTKEARKLSLSLESEPMDHRDRDLQIWNDSLKAKVAELRSQLRNNEAVNEKLLAEVQTLEEKQKNWIHKDKSLSAELAYLQSVRDQQCKEISTLKHKTIERQWQVDEIQFNQKVDLDSLKQNMQAEINTLKRKLHNLKEKDNFLLDQNNRVVAELVKVESQNEGLKTKNVELRAAVQYLEYDVEDAVNQKIKKEKRIEKQSRIIAELEEQINNLHKDREIKRQINQDLKDHLSLLQEEKTLADLTNLKGQCEASDRPQRSWFQGAKRLLKVGLGIAVVGLLIPAACWVTSMYYSCGAIPPCSPWDCTYNLLEPYCNF